MREPIEVLKIDHFYKKFELEKRKYKPSLFCVGSKTKRKRLQKVDFATYKKIVKEFLKMYFFEFYTSSDSIYFPLGGMLKKVVYDKWVHFMSKGKSEKRISGGDKAIGLFWYMRPGQKMYYMVKLTKLTGSSNQLPKIERFYNQNYDKDLLPIFMPELKKAKKNKTLYLCTLT
jgi:hypothetical protein